MNAFLQNQCEQKRERHKKFNIISFPLLFFPTGNYAAFENVNTIISCQMSKKEWISQNVGKYGKTVYNLSIDVAWRSFERKHDHNQNYLILDERKNKHNNIYKYMRTVLALFGTILMVELFAGYIFFGLFCGCSTLGVINQNISII